MPPTSDLTGESPPTTGPVKAYKQPPLNAQPFPKTVRKHAQAKVGGGSASTVNKIIPKVPKFKNTLANLSPQVYYPPEMKPVASQTSNGYPITSPLLDALSSASAMPTSTSQSTNDWAKNVPAFLGSGSPGNLITLGESPPNFESQSKAQSEFESWKAGSPAEREVRGSPHTYIPASSPPISNRRPLSFQLDGNISYEEQHAQKTTYAPHRSSMYANSNARFTPAQPLPHQAQPHFYTAPDIDLGLAQKLVPGEKGFYCGFDSLPSRDPTHVEDVLLVGYEGGVNVFRVEKNRLSKISILNGLRGGVYGAKILPWTVQCQETLEESPLIALVLHGSARQNEIPEYNLAVTNSCSDTVSTPHSGSAQGSRKACPTVGNDRANAVPEYETSVEVYSLGTKELVCTLLSTRKTKQDLPAFAAPEPSGALKVTADGSHVVISSGVSGEVFIYRYMQEELKQCPKFHCIGKLWTTLKLTSSSEHGRHGSSASSVDGDHGTTDIPNSGTPKKTAILSLRGRWLAYSPPVGSPQQSLRATIPGVHSTTRIPGFNAYQAPTHPPSVNCGVDLPDGESVLNRVARVTTQEVIKGAKWVSDQGFQAWNNYWSKPSGASQTNGSTYSNNWQAQPPTANSFPPTHGVATSQHARPNTEPNLVSMVDLDRLPAVGSYPPQPLVTFKPKGGCGFLSFSPSGLALFTANSTGDAQYVWDLMRVQYTRSSLLQGVNLSTPHVRQVAVFTRMTATNITDVVWSAPSGERLAIVTERRTAHILDLKESAFLWPPLRRKVKALMLTAANSNSEMSVEAGSSGISVVRNAAKGAWSMASPIIGAKRIRSSSTSMSAASITAQAGQGGKAIAGVISKSFGAAASETVKQLRKPGEIRLYLPGSPVPAGSACARWLGRHSNCLAVVSGDVVRTYPLKPRQHSGKRAGGVNRYMDLKLPSLPDPSVTSAILRDLPSDIGSEDQALGAYNMADAGLFLRRRITIGQPGNDSPIPHAEIESNAPYQPFHTDRRVALHIYSALVDRPPSPSVSALLSPAIGSDARQTGSAPSSEPWVFGRPIHTRKVDVGQPETTDDDNDVSTSHIAIPADALQRTMKIDGSEQEGEQIVITTRRRKEASAQDLDDDGFFEDDCDVLDFASQRV